MEPIHFSVIIIIEVIFAFFCAFIASQKNRTGGSWFVLGFLFGIIALIAVAAVPALSKVEQEQEPVEHAEPADRPSWSRGDTVGIVIFLSVIAALAIGLRIW